MTIQSRRCRMTHDCHVSVRNLLNASLESSVLFVSSNFKASTPSSIHYPTMQPALPVEFLQIIFGLMSEDVLPHVRATSKKFCALVTPRIFRVLRCTHTVASTMTLLQVLNRQDVSRIVEEFIYKDSYGTRALEVVNSPDPDRDDPHPLPVKVDGHTVQENLACAIQILLGLPKLRCIFLIFGPYISHHSFYQRVVIASLTTLCNTPLRSLTIECIEPQHLWVYNSPDLTSFFSDLTQLRLTTTREMTGHLAFCPPMPTVHTSTSGETVYHPSYAPRPKP